MNNSQISKAMQECISLIEQKRYLDAIHSLKLQIEHEPNAEMFALLGLTYFHNEQYPCLLYTSPSPRDRTRYRMPSSA